MTIQLSTAARNARLDAIETTIGTSAIVEIRTGSMPANVAAATTGTLLALASLPSDWMAAASGGTKAKSGTWQDASANATGDAGYFRIFASDGTTCGLQGTVTALAGGGDMEFQQGTVGLVSGQTFTIATFTLTDGNS